MFTAQCFSCRPSHGESNTLVYTEVGRAILRQDDQGPIGRCIFIPHKYISTMEELLANTEIIIDAYDFARRLNNALKTLYGCSKVAVCMIGNLTKNEQGEITAEERYEHRHFHIIPSYPKPVERYGTIFTEDTSKNQWEMIFYFRTVQYNLKSNNSTK